MNKYTTMTIKEAVGKIGAGDIYLPAIQRKFVWKHTQIERLFDSIMREYPIGTFLFWMLNGKNVHKYTFYKFIQEYHERDSINEIRPTPELKERIIGVLDGQQRLCSMYVALQGSYTYKKKFVAESNPNAYPIRRLFLNLMYNGTDDEDCLYEFKFLTEDEAKKTDAMHLWFDVRIVLEWGSVPETSEYYEERIIEYGENGNYAPETLTVFKSKEAKRQIYGNINTLYERIVKDDIISYYGIQEQELDKILDIFVRVNSAGTILSKSDLLFSTIVAHWEEGRNEIEELIEDINNIGDTFNFDTDFIMRTCLFVTESPIRFKVESFSGDTVKKILDNWEKIESAIKEAVTAVSGFGFNRYNLTSANAVIPIVHYFYNGGRDKNSDRQQLKLYIISALLKNIFSSSGEQTLTHLRNAMNDSLSYRDGFIFTRFSTKFNAQGSKKINIQSEELDEMLEYKTGAYTFMMLSLLYPHMKFGQIIFHQDHIHPHALFKGSEFKKIGLTSEECRGWLDKRNRLPNIQLLQGNENIAKGKTPFTKWLHSGKDYAPVDISKYKTDNYIDPKVSEELKDFILFYDKRRDLLREALKTAFGL